MKIALIGLGNPGNKYLLTPHNAGFMVIDALAKKYNLTFSSKFDANIAQLAINIIDPRSRAEIERDENALKYDHIDLYLIKPKTYMNNSGKAVLQANNFYKFDKIVVFYDDLDLPLGSIRVKPSGSSTHNGVRSIMDCVNEFIRVRIGIGKVKDVLANFSKEELDKLKKVLDAAVDIADKVSFMSIDKIMNEYNGRELC